MAPKIKIIFGVAAVGGMSKESLNEFMDILEKHGCNDLDTARRYPGSEKAIGEIGAPSKFTIHTKAPGFTPGCSKKEKVLEAAETSFRELGTQKVETYYLHSPDPETPIEETLEAIQELYEAGRFERFGLSNYSPSDVSKIHAHNSSKGYILPTVYQGNYNPVARLTESTLFPLLRKLNISFHAYSPLAGGFLTKTPQHIADASEGRWDKSSFAGNLYGTLYNRPSLIAALSEWDKISKDVGISRAALAYRWVAWNSILKPEFGDGIIVGASGPTQLEETLKAIEDGPLEEGVGERIQRIWESVKDEAPLDNYTALGQMTMKRTPTAPPNKA